jgi:uncharacterized protein
MVQTLPARRQGSGQYELIAPAVLDDSSTDVADIIDGLNAETGLPRRALRAAVDNWETALPFFLAMLDAYVRDPAANDKATDPLFFILHLFGQVRETRAYPLLMRFAAMAPDAVERVLGDGVTGTFSRVAASVFDGNPRPMQDAILNHGADEFIRSGLFEALALVTKDGKVERKSTEAFLLQCYTDLQPQHDSYAWVGWQSAISCLGLKDLASIVRRAFDSGKIDRSIMSFHHFEEDLAAAVSGASGAGRGHDQIGYFGDAIAELSRWHSFSEAARQPQLKSADQAGANPMPAVTRAVKQRGRPRGNDPCPCGSGKKYKKCCRDK